MLNAHAWPGNVRELENCVQRALVLCDADVLQPADLVLQPVVASGDTLQERVRSTEESVLLDKLAVNNGARKITAQQLGISERTLRYKLKQLKDKGAL
jgi:two-component system response regulator FlrC